MYRIANRTPEAEYVKDSKQHHHKSDGEFHGQADSGGDDKAECDDCGADDKDCERVPCAPQSTDVTRERSAAYAAIEARKHA
jgi:hypothetical protein